MSEKSKHFALWMRTKGIDEAVLLTTAWHKRDMNIVYFSGVDVHDFSCLVIKKTGKAYLLVREHEYANARNLSSLKDIRILREDLFSYLKKHSKGKVIGINDRMVSLRELTKLKKVVKAKFVDVSDSLMDLRQLKTDDELKLIAAACKYGDDIFKKCVKRFLRFKTEADVSAYLQQEMAKLGCKPAYDPIIAAGSNAAIIHHVPSRSRLKRGFVVMDFGVKYRNYCSDMTRTICVGSPTRAEREIYEGVLACQEKTLGFVKPGVTGKEVDVYARHTLGELSKWFIHGLGHQIGIDVHESSHNLNSRGDFMLKPGMVVTIEPGVYFPGRTGLRIEDTVIVTAGGCKRLTHASKELLCL